MKLRELLQEAQKDMTNEPCEGEKCGEGKYVETSQTDDIDGVLHCNECDHKVDRYRPLVNEGIIKRLFTGHKKKKDSKGTIRYYNKDGKLDDPDKDTPAVEFKNGDTEKWTNGKMTDTYERREGVITSWKNGKMQGRSSPDGGSLTLYDEKGKRQKKGHSVSALGRSIGGGSRGRSSRSRSGGSSGSYGGGVSSGAGYGLVASLMD